MLIFLLSRLVQSTIHFRILIYNMLGAPLFGVYLLGVLHPGCTGSGALIALFAGILCGVGLCINYQFHYVGMTTVGSDVTDCLPYFCHRMAHFDGCQTNQTVDLSMNNTLTINNFWPTFNRSMILRINQTVVIEAINRSRKPPISWPIDLSFTFLKHISYHMGGVLTLVVTILTGSIISLCTINRKNRTEIDVYLTPFLQKWPHPQEPTTTNLIIQSSTNKPIDMTITSKPKNT